MDELRDLVESTEKRISYMQARLEENDFFLMEILGDDEGPSEAIDSTKLLSLFNGFKTAEPEQEAAPDITIEKSAEPDYVARYDTGAISVSTTVRNYVNKMKKGDQIRPHAFGNTLFEMGIITEVQKSHVRAAFKDNKSMQRLERGLYQRV